MPKQWTAEEIRALSAGYQSAAVLAAAVDLDLFSAMAGKPFTAAQAAHKLQADLRGVSVLLDALAAMQLLTKESERYDVPPTVAQWLTSQNTPSMLAMSQHQANCLRRWDQLAAAVKTGRPAERRPSIRGPQADLAAFIEAMDNISAPIASKVVGDLGTLKFTHLLDVGGASGSWTIAFLRANPAATATIFDLPEVIPQATARLKAAGLADRVRFVAGDYNVDAMPKGADLAWVSAIIHQNSRRQNRELFAKVAAALPAGGQILIRDIVMAPSRTEPPMGALFAVNMLVGTDGGGTFTLDEIRQDLAPAGFADVAIIRPDPGMNVVVRAVKK